MINEPKAMREIHIIRENLYQKRKDMSDKEIIEDINKKANIFINKYNL